MKGQFIYRAPAWASLPFAVLSLLAVIAKASGVLPVDWLWALSPLWIVGALVAISTILLAVLSGLEIKK